MLINAWQVFMKFSVIRSDNRELSEGLFGQDAESWPNN